jgi:hypothetical protein
MNQLRHTQSTDLAERFYFYRGIVIQSLTKQLGMKENLKSDAVLAGILMLLLIDVC